MVDQLPRAAILHPYGLLPPLPAHKPIDLPKHHGQTGKLYSGEQQQPVRRQKLLHRADVGERVERRSRDQPAQDGFPLHSLLLRQLKNRRNHNAQHHQVESHLDNGQHRNGVQCIFYRAAQVNGVFHAHPRGNHQGGIVHRNHAAEYKEEQKLVKALRKVPQNQAADHLIALDHVEQLAHQKAKENRNRGGKGHCGKKAAYTCQSPVGSEEDRHLGCHGADHNAEVQAHARDNRDNQSQHDKGISGNSGKELPSHKRQGLLGGDSSPDAEHHKEEHHLILKQNIGKFSLIHVRRLLSPGSAHRE